MSRVGFAARLFAAHVAVICAACIVSALAFYSSSASLDSEDQAAIIPYLWIIVVGILLMLMPAALVSTALVVANKKSWVAAVVGAFVVGATLALVENPIYGAIYPADVDWSSLLGKLAFYETCWIASFLVAMLLVGRQKTCRMNSRVQIGARPDLG